MTTGYMIVESKPASPEALEDYSNWYDQTHLPEILAVEGFVSARRLETLEGGTFVVLYELDIDPATAIANLRATKTTAPVGVCLDPPPTVRYFRQITELTA